MKEMVDKKYIYLIIDVEIITIINYCRNIETEVGGYIQLSCQMRPIVSVIMRKTVLITGTSSGIGKKAAQLFAARGWNVAATSRHPTFDPPSAAGIFHLPMDIADELSVAQAVEAVLGRFGTIDALVNNAGYGLFGPLEGATSGELEAQFETNFFALARVTRHVLPIMRNKRSGVIVNLSSIGGRAASPFASGYQATKYAVEGFSESLRFELSLHGIRVKLIEPAHFKTGFFARSLRCTGHPAYDRAFHNYMGWVRSEDERAPDPFPVAEAIYKAAQDTSGRLRYPVKGRLSLALATLLPDALWRSLLAEGMKRRVPEPRHPAPQRNAN